MQKSKMTAYEAEVLDAIMRNDFQNGLLVSDCICHPIWTLEHSDVNPEIIPHRNQTAFVL